MELLWATWRSSITALCAKGPPSLLDYADSLERSLEQHAPVQTTVRLNVADDVYPRSCNWAHLTLGIPLSADSLNPR